jgi:flavin reductase (DIM6/NTAB) family NADH-FMN oxidoreductase RutF
LRTVSPEIFRAALGRFATGVTVVTTVVDGQPHGMTANAFSSASLDPPLILVCVDHEAVLHDLLGESEAFGVSILAAAQEHLSIWFATADRPGGRAQFADVAWAPGAHTGAPLLDGAAARLECRPAGRFPAGDHSVFLGEVVAAELDSTNSPLLFLDGAYRD